MFTKLLHYREKTIERQVISGIIADRNIPPDIMPEYFEGDERLIYDEIDRQYAKNGNIDATVLHDTNNVLDIIFDTAPTTSIHAIEKLRNAYLKRRFARIVAKVKLRDNAETEISELISETGKLILSGKSVNYDHNKELSTLMQCIEKNAKKESGLAGLGIGIEPFDLETNGIEKSKLYALGALKKSGKSRFMIYSAIRLAEQGARVLINTLEMSSQQLNLLALSYYSGINSRHIFGKMPKRDFPKLNDAVAHTSNLNWLIYREKTVPELRTRIHYENSKKKIDYVFVDFIQRMRDEKYKNDRVREVESIAMQLADLSRDADCGIIALSQLSGRAENLAEDEMPDMRHYKESQAIPENADCILTMKNTARSENPYTEDGAYRLPVMKMRVEQRYDVSGSVISFLGDLRTCKFKEDKYD